jgi:hypothetical protein
MEMAVKKTIVGGFSLFVLVSGLGLGGDRLPVRPPETPEAFISRVHGFLRERNLAAYLDAFVPGIRPGEQDRLDLFFDTYGMNNVSFRLAGRSTGEAGEPQFFLQAFFQNDQAVMMESWMLKLGRDPEGWVIAHKEATGNVSILYKIRMPSDRFERARWLEITHQDIRLSFRDAAVFYDNLPDTETALIVIGKGTVHFTPSDVNEKHQMELLYKKPYLEDTIEYLYIRCSPSYFAANIKIDREEGLRGVSPRPRRFSPAAIPALLPSRAPSTRSRCPSCPRARRPSSNSRPVGRAS